MCHQMNETQRGLERVRGDWDGTVRERNGEKMAYGLRGNGAGRGCGGDRKSWKWMRWDVEWKTGMYEDLTGCHLRDVHRMERRLG